MIHFNASNYLIKQLNSQSILWFKATNSYVLVATQTAKLIERINQGLCDDELIEWCVSNLKLSNDQSKALLSTTFKLIAELAAPKPVMRMPLQTPKNIENYAVIRYYKIAHFVVKVSFKIEALAFLILPKFDYLRVAETAFNSEFEVSLQDENIVFWVDMKPIGIWSKTEIEYFQGKFSMCLIEKLYGKTESEWMGVFHASALSDGENSILFMGDSGNGKSTLAAILMAKGFNLLADDFVPVLADNQQIYYFPAAVSIKEAAVSALIPFYPKLGKTEQYHFVNLNKKVHYLAPTIIQKTLPKHLPCKAFVFVKYRKNSPFKFKKIDSEVAFQHLVPDAWLSPNAQNAQQFLDWFAQMPCYQLNYSNTESMCQTVDKLFKDDL